MLRLDNIRIYENLNRDEVVRKALKKYRIRFDDVIGTDIIRKSIDARKKNDIHYLYTLAVTVKDESRYPNIPAYKEPEVPEIKRNRNSQYDPVIIGSGPSGLFCALTLIENGYKPIIIEQGNRVEERIEDIRKYRESGILNTQSNVQFGEGGAGTFSDGKLTTGINSVYI